MEPDQDDDDDDDWADFSSAEPPPLANTFNDFNASDTGNTNTSNSNDCRHSNSEHLSSVNSTDSSSSSHDHSEIQDASETTSPQAEASALAAASLRHSQPTAGEASVDGGGVQNVGHSDGEGQQSDSRQASSSLSDCRQDTQDNTSQESITDSGMCSDISPVPKFEDYPDFGDFKSSDGIHEESLSNQKENGDKTEGTLGGLHNSSNSTKSDDVTENVAETCTEDSETVSHATNEPDTSGDNSGININADSNNSKPESDTDFVSQSLDISSDSHSKQTDLTKESSEVDVPSDSENETFHVETIELEFRKPSISEDDIDEAEENDDDFDDFSPYVVSSTIAEENDSADSTASQNEDSKSTTPEIHSPHSEAVTSESPHSEAVTSQSPHSEAVTSDTLTQSSTAQVSSTSEPCDKNNDDDDDDDDFGDFSNFDSAPKNSIQQPKSVDHQDDDDFGGFNDFDNREDKSVKAAVTEAAAAADDDDDDEWGGFDGADDAVSNEEWNAFGSSETSAEKNGESDWASFQGTDPPAPKESMSAEGKAAADDDWGKFDDDDDDDFGNFEDVSPSTPTASAVTPTTPQTERSVLAGGKVQLVMQEAFPGTGHLDNTGSGSVDVHSVSGLLQLIDQVRKATTTTTEKPQLRAASKKETVDVNVWNNLKTIDDTNALQYVWGSSSNSRRLLKALSIDTRNILIGVKKTPVPIFAANLGLLEPSRGPTQPSDGTDASLVDTKPTVQQPVSSPQDNVAPAEFDWDSSGLSNPLDTNSAITLDLDFLAGSSFSPTTESKSSALENEFLGSVEPVKPKTSTLQPLENLLANMKFTSTTTGAMNRSEETLTTEAEKVVTRFPDLSFMRAKVLMFPLRQVTVDDNTS